MDLSVKTYRSGEIYSIGSTVTDDFISEILRYDPLSFLSSSLYSYRRVSFPVAFLLFSLFPYLFPFTWCVQVLRSPKEAFPAAMQSWRERCEKCVCLQGDYGEK